MLRADLRQINVNINDPFLSDQLRRLIEGDTEFRETVLYQVTHELLMSHHYDIEEGWEQEPDRILVTIPFSLFPERESDINKRREEAKMMESVESDCECYCCEDRG